MRDLLDQTLQASDAGLYFLALSGALIVPSLANALEHETGEDQGGAAYGGWYDAWVRRPDDFADGEAAPGRRCCRTCGQRRRCRAGRGWRSGTTR